jgi:hypothetical protein
MGMKVEDARRVGIGLPMLRNNELTSKLTAIRNYTFKDVTPKENLFQKLFKRENVKEYEIRTSMRKKIL